MTTIPIKELMERFYNEAMKQRIADATARKAKQAKKDVGDAIWAFLEDVGGVYSMPERQGWIRFNRTRQNPEGRVRYQLIPGKEETAVKMGLATKEHDLWIEWKDWPKDIKEAYKQAVEGQEEAEFLAGANDAAKED
jgi:hypothetical protein